MNWRDHFNWAIIRSVKRLEDNKNVLMTDQMLPLFYGDLNKHTETRNPIIQSFGVLVVISVKLEEWLNFPLFNQEFSSFLEVLERDGQHA